MARPKKNEPTEYQVGNYTVKKIGNEYAIYAGNSLMWRGDDTAEYLALIDQANK